MTVWWFSGKKNVNQTEKNREEEILVSYDGCFDVVLLTFDTGLWTKYK